MIESLVLIEGQNVSEETLMSVSLMNAKQLVVGTAPGNRVILHVAANSYTDLGSALLRFGEVPDVIRVLPFVLQNP